MDADLFFSRLNPLMLAILRSPLHALLSAGLMALTVTGRRSGRRSGAGLLALFVPLVLSGIGVQILTAEAWQRAAVWIHLVAGGAYLAFFVGHRVSVALRARPRQRQVVPLASRRADT